MRSNSSCLYGRPCGYRGTLLQREALTDESKQLLYNACKAGRVALVDQLLTLYPSIDVNKGELETPLSISISNGHLDIVDRLINHITIPDVNLGIIPLLYNACEAGNVAVVDRLLKFPNIDVNKGIGIRGVLVYSTFDSYIKKTCRNRRKVTTPQHNFGFISWKCIITL